MKKQYLYLSRIPGGRENLGNDHTNYEQNNDIKIIVQNGIFYISHNTRKFLTSL